MLNMKSVWLNKNASKQVREFKLYSNALKTTNKSDKIDWNTYIKYIHW